MAFRALNNYVSGMRCPRIKKALSKKPTHTILTMDTACISNIIIKIHFSLFTKETLIDFIRNRWDLLY